MKKTISIIGINCANCVTKITNALYSLPQIDSIKINIENKNAEVTFFEDIDNETLKAIISNTGNYTVTDIK